MIEVPSAVYQMDALVKRVDFFSVGTNDLTQYLLAVDRNNKQVTGLYNSLHPSVLHAVRHVVTVAHQHNKPVGVCGEMAGDPVSALVLAGLGIDSLSMNVGSLLRVKLAIRSFARDQLENMATAALTMEKPGEIRQLFTQALEQTDAGRLVRVTTGL